MDIKKILHLVAFLFVLFLCYLLVNTYIKNQIDKKVATEREHFQQQLADRTIELENKRIAEEAKLKTSLLHMQKQRDECNVQIQEDRKKEELKKLSKKDPKKFKKIVDETLGVKGKK